MKFLTLVLFTGFIILSIFGFSSAIGAESLYSCLASSVGGTCPIGATSLNLINHHAEAYGLFSSFVISVSLVASIAAMFALIFESYSPLSPVVFRRIGAMELVNSFKSNQSTHLIRRFLSRFENSPSFL